MPDTKQIVGNILRLLNDLEDTLQDKYRTSPDNPGLITQLQAARNIRIIINNNFPNVIVSVKEEIVEEVVEKPKRGKSGGD